MHSVADTRNYESPSELFSLPFEAVLQVPTPRVHAILVFPPTFTLALHPSYRDCIALTSPSLTCVRLASYNFYLFTLSYAFSKSKNAANVCLRANNWSMQLLFAVNLPCSSITFPLVHCLSLVQNLSGPFPSYA